MSLKTIKKLFQITWQGETYKDKFFILSYFILKFFQIIRNHKLLGNVTVKSKDGIFFCGDNMYTVWCGSSFHERELRPFINLDHGVFIDVGANIGKFSIILGKKMGRLGKIIAVEPHPSNFAILKKNILLNKLKNVIPQNIALSDSNGKLKLYIDKEGTGGHSLGVKRGESAITVEADTMDNMIRKLKIKKVDLIKIDVEGAEALVLKGAKNILKTSHPKIAFEAWDKPHLKMVKGILDKFGYTIQRIDSDNYFASCGTENKK